MFLLLTLLCFAIDTAKFLLLIQLCFATDTVYVLAIDTANMFLLLTQLCFAIDTVYVLAIDTVINIPEIINLLRYWPKLEFFW